MALLARARELAALIRHAGRDACCYLCLSELAAGFAADPSALDEARLGVRQFWTACVFAITHGWISPEYVEDKAGKQRRNLRAALAACARHKPPAHDPNFNILHEFVCAAAACLHIALSSGRSSIVERGTHSKRPIENKAGIWPQRREAIFFYGEENTVTSVLFWCYKIGSPNPMLLLTDMVRIAHPLVVPEILERDGLRRQLMLGIVRRLSEYVSWKIGKEPRSWGDTPLPPTLPGRYKESLRAALGLLTSVLSSPDALPNLLLLFIHELEFPLFGLLNQARAVMDCSDPSDDDSEAGDDKRSDDDSDDDDDDDDLAHSAALVASAVYAVAPPPKEPLCDEIHAIVASYGTLTLFDVLHELLDRCATVRRLCYTCGRTAHAQDLARDGDRDTHFLACGRCQTTRYCGRDCQLSGWKTGDPTPHRAVCALLERIRAVAGPEMPRPEFSAALTALEFTQEELRTLSLLTLNPRLVPVQALFRAADIHRELFAGSPYPPASSKALANVSALKKMVDARRAGRTYDAKKLFSMIIFHSVPGR